MRTWGVDLSTSASDTGVVSIDWPESGSGTFTRHRDEVRERAGLVMRIADTAESEWWAVDVPFGWPIGFGDFLVAHLAGPADLKQTNLAEQRPWAHLARRRTDLAVIGEKSPDGGRGVSGFSVSFDKLGATAAAWASIEWELSLRDVVIDRSGFGDAVKVCETYPAAAWRRWSLPDNPSSAGVDAFRRAVEHVVQPDDGDWTMNGHERDAVVCALVARARALDRTDGPPASQLDLVRREGWIHLPKNQVTISSLAS